MSIVDYSLNWKVFSLSKVCDEITSGGAAPQGDIFFENGTYPFVRVADMGANGDRKYLSSTKDKLNETGIKKLRLFPKGTVLFTKSGASLLLNQRAILKSPMYIVSHIGCLVPNEYVTSDWLYYWMRQVDFAHYSHATTLPSLKLTTLKNLQIPVPSMQKQERIVAKIEELFSELDKAVEALETIQQQLIVYRQAVLKEAFDNLATIQTAEVCIHITDGDHQPPPKTESGIPFIVISNIHGNQINWDKTFYVSDGYYNSIGEKRTPKMGDVLYTVTGSFGIPVKVDFDRPFCFQRHIALLRPNERITQDFLFYALQSPTVYQQAKEGATGTAQKTVGLKTLREISIPFIPSIKDQTVIVKIIEKQLSMCGSIEQTVSAALQQAAALRQSILKQAFEGKLIS